MGGDGVRLLKRKPTEPRAYAKTFSLDSTTLTVGPGFREMLGSILIAVHPARFKSVLSHQRGNGG